MPGIDADGAVPRGVRQGQGLIWFGVGLAGVVVAGDGDAVLAGAAVLAGPGDRVGVEHAAGWPAGSAGARHGRRSAAVSAAALYPASMMTSGAPRAAVPGRARRRSRFLTCRAVCRVRVAGVVRSTSTRAAHAVRRCPSAAMNWYSQPGMVLRVPSQRQAS